MKYALLYVPYGLAVLFSDDPATSYWVAWLGSFYIIFLVLSGAIKPRPADLSFIQQFMRPYIFVHLMFITYMALGSVFYFLDANGYYYFEKNALKVMDLNPIAACQRYYVLGHAAFAHGLLCRMNYARRPGYTFLMSTDNLFRLTVASFVMSTLVRLVPPLAAAEIYFVTLGTLISVVFFITALERREKLPVAATILLLNIISGFMSGMKEATLVIFAFLLINLFPKYKKSVIVLGLPLLYFYLMFLPTFNGEYRKLAWYGGVKPADAVAIAIDNIRTGVVDYKRTNWEFFTIRLSEIGMFTIFTENVPRNRDFYGSEILESALTTLIPRILWPDKPIADEAPMQRTYENGALSRDSEGTSAKPHFIVDAYLSGGEMTIFMALFLFGLAATQLSMIAERLFGGYILGSCIIFNAFFYVFLKGNCFENVLNPIFYGYVLMLVMHKVFIQAGVLLPNGTVPAPAVHA